MQRMTKMDSMNDFEYYSKVNQLQEFLRQKEERRMELDQEFTNFMKSDENRSFTRADKLQAYWKHLCEQEKMSHVRNQKLLQEFNRVEAHIATLAVRTDRLRVVQEKYQKKIDQMYPNWRQCYLDKTRRQQHSTGQMELQQEERSRIYGEDHLKSRQRTQIQTYPAHEQSTTRPRLAPRDQVQSLTEDPLPLPTQPEQPLSLNSGLEPHIDYHRHHSVEPNRLPYNGSGTFAVVDPGGTAMQGGHVPHTNQGGVTDQGGVTVQGFIPHSVQGGIPHVYQSGMTRQEGIPHNNQGGIGMQRGIPLGNQDDIPHTDQGGMPHTDVGGATVQGNVGYEIPVSRGIVAHRQIYGSSSHQQGRTGSDQGGDVSSRTEPFSSSSGEDSQGEERESTPDEEIGVQRRPTSESPEKIQPSDSLCDVQAEEGRDEPSVGGDSLTASNEDTIEAPLATAVVKPDDPSRPQEGSDEDFESDLSLPLSEDQAQSPPNHEFDVPIGPELTTNGYLHLLQGIENIIESCDQQLDVYDNERCSQNEQSCITEDANSKLPLDNYEPVSLSSVLLHQLPLLVRASPRGYLLSDHVLKSDRPILEVTVRSAITTNALPYWDRTLKHMVFLIKRGYFEPEEIAEKVAPLMVSKDSTLAEKAVRVVTSLLEDAAEEPTLDDSSITHTSLEETPAETPAQPIKVPPLNLDVSGEMKASSDEDDSFFDQNVPLKETDAYKQMLQSMKPKSGSHGERQDEDGLGKDAESLLAELEESSSDDGEDIEKAAMVTPPSSGRSLGGRPKQNVLSSLGGSDVFGQVENGNENRETGMKSLTPKDGSGEESSPEKSDVISSTSETPREAGGYIPSGMDNSLKSSGRKSEALNRSSAFWGEESDLDESEMSVPMGTGGMEDDKDDFDFYD